MKDKFSPTLVVCLKQIQLGNHSCSLLRAHMLKCLAEERAKRIKAGLESAPNTKRIDDVIAMLRNF